jgi:hypothetical protein
MGHQHALLPAKSKLLTPSPGNLPIRGLGKRQSDVWFDLASLSRDKFGKELGCFSLEEKIALVVIIAAPKWL